jgi:hypothetical protein
MLKKQKTVVVAGIVISAILFFACLATILSLGQISIKASAENMTSSSRNGNASMMMANKTAANSDVLMTKVRNMGIGNNTIADGSGSASSNMINHTSG